MLTFQCFQPTDGIVLQNRTEVGNTFPSNFKPCPWEAKSAGSLWGYLNHYLWPFLPRIAYFLFISLQDIHLWCSRGRSGYHTQKVPQRNCSMHNVVSGRDSPFHEVKRKVLTIFKKSDFPIFLFILIRTHCGQWHFL